MPMKNFPGSVTRIVLNEDGSFFDTPGVNLETTRVSVVGQNTLAIALRVEGHSAWNGRFTPRRHIPVELIVCRVISSKKVQKRTEYRVEPLLTFSPNRPKPNKVG